jgi:hypothetical protein
MVLPVPSQRTSVAVCVLIVVGLAVQATHTQQSAPQFGGAYAGLDSRRQMLVNDWIDRFVKTTGQQLETAPFYDEILTLSSKTTFDAVTHALMTTPLTDESGTRVGDALALIERVESVRGEIPGASGDRQFRMYVRLKADALDTLNKTREFKRGVDNSVYHKGYPINYRAQGGPPSIQISIAPDHRRADIDVDYRSSGFPIALFNGHLTASNSDIRAGDNSERHSARWAGLQNWWGGFFGIRLDRAPAVAEKASALTIPRTPRAGKKDIDVMAYDFLHAWLVEGDAMAAMGYVSDRAYACMAQDADDPSDFDRGMAPFQLLNNLKAAHEAVGKRDSLEGLTVGVRLTSPALKVVTQPHHAQFVISAVPDDVAAAFDCESRLTLSDSKKVARAYGNYYGATFYVSGRKDQRVALLWAKENGYWKIVSWDTGSNDEDSPAPAASTEVSVARIKPEPSLVQSARQFLEAWLVRKDYDAAFKYLSTKSYGCYDLERNPTLPAATSPADAGAKIREGLARAGDEAGRQRNLDALLEAVEPIHPSVRVMDHQYARTFSLTSIPNALGDASECDARSQAAKIPDPLPPEYGDAFGMLLRFRTGSGDAPVLRVLWRKEGSDWRITSYDVELP